MKSSKQFTFIFFIVIVLWYCMGIGNNIAQSSGAIVGTPQMLENMKANIYSTQNWHPFPRASDREVWMAVNEDVRRSLLSRGEKGLKYNWPSLPATLFLEFARTGNRRNYERQSFAHRSTLRDLVLAECVEGEGRFTDDIVNGIWAICEESFWGVPAHLNMQKSGPGLPDVTEPTVDLFASETSSLLAWTIYLLGPQLDKVSPLVRQRVLHELNARILTPCLERDDFWWMGFGERERVNNWNPWCNSNWLTTVLLVEEDEARRLAAVEKIMKSLDKFIAGYHPDGGCDEGPSYWTRAAASLFDCLELLHSATNGAVNLYDNSLVQEMGRYIYRVHIYDNYFINFADAPAKLILPADLVFRYGKRINDERLMRFGAYFAERQLNRANYISGSIGRQLPAIFNYNELIAVEPLQPLLRDVWMDGIQVMAARSQEGSEKGLYLAAKGGHNAESHNHNDVGNFIVYVDGLPMIIDVGVETYTRKTFSAQRYDIWTMQSQYHNLPTINGVMQKPGREYAATDVSYSAEQSFAQLQLNLAKAYPAQAEVNSWLRTLRLNRGNNILVFDDYELTRPAQKLTFSLMTPCEVAEDEVGQVRLQETESSNGNDPTTLRVYYDAEKFKLSTNIITFTDDRLRSVWGDQVTRILLTAENPQLRDKWILRIAP